MMKFATAPEDTAMPTFAAGTRVRDTRTGHQATVIGTAGTGHTAYVNVDYDSKAVYAGALGTQGHTGGGPIGYYTEVIPDDPWTV
jgi:hypothetical protein